MWCATPTATARANRAMTKVDVECHTTGQILCNEIEIEQVLVNMINNGIDAVKDSEERWVKISAFEDISSVVLQIQDSGLGVDPKIQSKLFQPFFTTKKVGEGTGLGLSIVKGILDEHEATIEIMADTPTTCFEIRFRKPEVR